MKYECPNVEVVDFVAMEKMAVEMITGELPLSGESTLTPSVQEGFGPRG